MDHRPRPPDRHRLRTRPARLTPPNRSPVLACAASQTEGSAISASAARPIPAVAAGRLAASALNIAAGAGEASPASIEAVATTLEMALTVTNGGRIPGSNRQDAYLVVMRGDFKLSRAPRPPRAKAPNGHYLMVYFDPTTFDVLGVSLRDQALSMPLQSVGPVADLTQQKRDLADQVLAGCG
jgi:hypothetical protein